MRANNDLISRAAFDMVLRNLENRVAHRAFTEGIMVARRELASAPAVEAVSPEVVEQYKWERDTAIAQLAELRIGFGEKMPELQRVRHGRWIRQDDTFTRYMCSECESKNHDGYEKYCPNCGAKMDLGVENDGA